MFDQHCWDKIQAIGVKFKAFRDKFKALWIDSLNIFSTFFVKQVFVICGYFTLTFLVKQDFSTMLDQFRRQDYFCSISIVGTKFMLLGTNLRVLGTNLRLSG